MAFWEQSVDHFGNTEDQNYEESHQNRNPVKSGNFPDTVEGGSSENQSLISLRYIIIKIPISTKHILKNIRKVHMVHFSGKISSHGFHFFSFNISLLFVNMGFCYSILSNKQRQENDVNYYLLIIYLKAD